MSGGAGLFAAVGDAGGEGLDRLEGTLEAMAFRNEENGFTIARLERADGDAATILITLPTLMMGERLEVWGRWESHQRFGAQFRVERYAVLKPASAEAMERYLGGGLISGVGKKLAKDLVEHFGTETLDIIEQHPERLHEVRGIGKKKAGDIVTGWEAQRGVRHIMLFLQGHGISAAYASRIYKQYGEEAIAVVSANPYRLARDVFGIGFKTADRIALRIGLAQDTPERVEAGVLFALQQAGEQGHCFLPERMLAQTAAELLTSLPEGGTAVGAAVGAAPTPEAAAEAIERLVRAQLLVRDPDDLERKPIYQKAVFVSELQLGRALRALVANAEPLSRVIDPERLAHEVEAQLGTALADLQREAVVESLRRRTLILTGGPGTGKTTTTRAILAAQHRLERRVLLASPTGRAAKRLAEVTSEEACTIHRLLEVDAKSFTFKRNAERPLECDTLIVDEASMLDLHLAYALVRALPEGAQLILVGDADQLPSVGAGNVLRDLIACGTIPVVRLTEVFRQAAASTIIANAHRVNSGEMPTLVPTHQWQSSDCLYIAQDEPEAAARKIADVVGRSLPTLGYSRAEVQVLTPMQRGVLGAQNLNILLQEALNPARADLPEFTRGFLTLREGDRVIQTVNDYDRDVFNGDIGYLNRIDTHEKALVVAYPEKDVVYPFDKADALQLAYALTVHKSQGSEYPAVVLALHTQHYLLLQRNLVYTGLTRAKKLAVLIGSTRAISIAVRNSRVAERFTRLGERMRGAE